MESLVRHGLELMGLADHDLAYRYAVLGIIALTSLLIHILLHQVVFRLLIRDHENDQWELWYRALVSFKLFRRLAFTLQGVILNVQARVWLDMEGPVLPFLDLLTQLWIMFFSLLSLFSLLSAIESHFQTSPLGRGLPVRGMSQSLKLAAAVLTIIFAVSLLIGKSPVIIFSGLGAMTAVVLLVFKDPILGLVAGIQLSANNMLAVGDWLEMPKYGADGDVIDISLTTVKVRNWDKTITTVPSHALISDSFKNWRGIEESGGRRFTRAVHIDVTSVRFLDEDDVEHLRKMQLMTRFIEEKVKEIEEDNTKNGVSMDSRVNGRRLTNIGVFRAYLVSYLKHNRHLNHDLTYMVRQLEPGPHGIPMQVYGFTKTTVWVDYENIQSDIFDHIFAVIPEFGLRVHQHPTGYDLTLIGSRLD